MNRNRHPSPPEECLENAYPSSQKGGTLIVEEVTDLLTHEQRLDDPGGYRPKVCARCAGPVLHVHDYRARMLCNEAAVSTSVVRYRCVLCQAIWRMLPGFLARRLWHRWAVVEQYVEGGPSPTSLAQEPSKQTVRRWRSRLQASAKRLVGLLATSGDAVLEGVAKALGLTASRQKLVWTHAAASGAAAGQQLAQVASLVHRLSPGLRLM